MKYTRYIEVNENRVVFNGQDAVDIDCSAIKATGVAFVVEDPTGMWVERQPFDGRVYEYDFTVALQLFDAAEKLYQEQNTPEPVDDSPTITPLQGLLALDRAGLADQYVAWTTDPSRTFSEKAYIDRAAVWRRDDAVLTSAASALGISETQLDELFALASTL